MAINQNIFGYMPVESVDWAKQMNSLSGTISGIGERREKEKEYLDQLKTDNIKTIQTSDAFASQNFGQMMLASSQEGVGTIKAWNDALKRGELDPKQYKQNMNNLMESWGTLGNSIKSFDAKNAELQKKLQDGTASKASVEAAQYFAKMGDIKNMKVFIDPSNGNVSTGRLDPNTGQVIPDTIDSAKTSADPSNAVFDKVNLAEAVSQTTKLWKPYVTENGITTVSDLTKREGFSYAVSDLVGSLTSNDRMTLSILQDNTNGNYQTYYTEGDRTDLLVEAVNRENQSRRYRGEKPLSGGELDSFINDAGNKLIAMKKDPSGVYQPVITELHKQDAEKAVINSIEMQLEFKSTQDEITFGRGGTSSEIPKEKFNTLSEYVVNNWGSASALNNQARPGYKFKWDSGTLNVYKEESDGRGGIDLTLIGPIPSQVELGKYLGITNTQLDDWKAAVERAKGKKPSAKTTKPKTTKSKTGGSGVNWNQGG
jgi:hypothetical protein